MANKREKEKKIKKTERKSFFRKYFYETIIFLFSFFLFANSISNDYNLDDELVTINHRLTSKGVSAIPEIFSSSYYKDDMGYAYEYRPVVLSSFAIEHQLFGDNPHVSHFLNVLLYALCCLLLFRVLINISNVFSPAFSFIVTLLFAAHSSHTEVVSSIKNRDEILGLIFCLLTFFIAIRAIHKSKFIFLILLPAIFSLALMNKITFLPFAVIIPFALIIFTEVNFVTLIFVSFFLVLPPYFLINSVSFSDKVFICFGLMTGPVLLFLLLRFQTVFQLCKRAVGYIYKPFEEAKIFSENDSDFVGYKGFFTNLSPPSSFLSFYPIVSTMLLALTYLGGVFFDLPLLDIIALPLLFILAWKGNEKWSWWANVLIYLCLPLTLFRWHDLLFSNLASIPLCYQVFFGNRKLRAPAAIALLLCMVLAEYFLQNDNPIFYTLYLSLFRTKINWLALIGGGTGILYNLIFSAPTNFALIKYYFWNSDSSWTNDYFDLFVSLPLAVSIFFRKGSIYLIWFCKLTAFLLFVSFQIKTNNYHPQFNIRNKIEILGKGINTKVTNEMQDRPINYVEQPVSYTDSWQIRTGTSMRVLFHYFVKTIIPYPLSFYYGYKFISPEKITNPVPLLSVFIYLLLILAALYFLKRSPLITFGIGIYLISMLAFANYFLAIPGIVGDRYLLIPSLGWSILLAVILFKLWKVNIPSSGFSFSQIPRGFKYSFGVVLCFYSVITFSRNLQWKDSLTLFRHDIKYVDQSAQAHNLLALHIMKDAMKNQDPIKKAELIREALVHFKSAVRIYPSFFNATYDMGRVYMELNMPDSAIWAFKRALTIDTSFYTIQINLGNLLFAKGEYREAVPYLGYIIRASPYEYTGYDKLSFAYFKLNEFDKSIEVNKEAIRQIPLSVDPYVNIGRTYLGMQQSDSARYYFQKANEMSPGNPMVQQLLQQIGSR